jgi:SAM-dependent methyltransferase
MQITTGIRSILALPFVYRLAMRILGNTANRRWFINDILALRGGEKVVDVGCGPADILSDLPATVAYVGLDVSEPYIEAARERYGERATFIAGDVDDWAADERVRNADLVFMNGVLHHVDDAEAKRLLVFVHKILGPNGRFIFCEPCYLLWQSRVSAFMMSLDRGQNIRTEQEWKNLVGNLFSKFETNIVTSVNRLGYIWIVGQCSKVLPLV